MGGGERGVGVLHKEGGGNWGVSDKWNGGTLVSRRMKCEVEIEVTGKRLCMGEMVRL